MAFSCLLFKARLIAIVRQRVTNNSKSHWSVNERGIGCLKHSSLHARLTDWGKGSWNNKEGINIVTALDCRQRRATDRQTD